MADHILVLPENHEGKDTWIGDVHGGLTAFKKFLASLKKGSRGFCVGDLIDRGEDSLGVIDAIIKHNKKVDVGENKGRLYAIYGNHEDNMVTAISILEKSVTLYPDQTIAEMVDENRTLSIIGSDNNGGKWIYDLFQQEMDTGLITVDEKTKKIIYSVDSKVKMVRDYMSELPYIIYVSGKTPVVGVHADMPIGDKELQRKIKKGNLTLTDEQREYAIWAREQGYIEFKPVGRSEHSILAFVGHNTVREGIHCIRHETNTIDLDFASFHYGIIMGVSMPSGKVRRYGKLKEAIGEYPEAFYNAEAKSIEAILSIQNK